MIFLHDAALNRPLNRRQFGKVPGKAAVLMAGATYGGIAVTEKSAARTSVRTAFGKMSIIRARRLPRLDAQGHSTAINHLTVTSVFSGRGVPDSGRIRVSGASGTNDRHGHGDAPQNAAWPQPLNLTWVDVLVLRADIYNESPQPVLFSPAQFRLKHSPLGTTVTPKDFDRLSGMLDANARERIRISYLASHSFSDFELEFSDGAHESVLRLAMPSVTTMEVFS